MDTNQQDYTDIEENSLIKQEAKEQVKVALEKTKVESLISKHIKNYFDKKYGPNWHCIVGKNYHISISYISKYFIHFYEGPICVVLYKMD